MRIGGLQKTTLIDFPGNVACAVFFLGCTFRCPFCHNPEIVLDNDSDVVTEIPEGLFLDFLKERKSLLDGVVLTGGEPTIYPDLPDFIKKIRNLGFLVKLDSNGTNPQMLECLIRDKMIDYIAMDIKAPLAKYKQACGVDFDIEKIKQSINLIKNSGVDYEFRTTVVPGLHTKEDIIQLACDIAPAKKYFLQNFRPQNTLNPEFENRRPFSDEEMEEMRSLVKDFFEICQIR